jgi:EAL domain-containing protein (putative c-di-GMP-specific phosphodiesterase class I)
MATDPIDLAVVESIQKIARVMGIRTVAESVENDAILTAATLVGVDYAQGFHLARPKPLSELLARPALSAVDQRNRNTSSAVSPNSARA